MFTIGKLSQLVKVSPRMLRYYEKVGLFYPAELDKTNGYRLYRAEQIPLLLRIVNLRDMGYSVDEITDFVDHLDNLDYLVADLKRKQQEIENEVRLKESQIEALQFSSEKLQMKNQYITCDLVQIKEIEEYRAETIRTTISSYEEQEVVWSSLAEQINHKLFTQPSLTIYHGFDEVEQIDIEVGFITAEGNTIVPPALVASVRCQGPLEHVLPEGEASCLKWAMDNGYEIIGPERVINLQHPMNQLDKRQFLTEIQYPIRKKAEK